MIRRVHTSSIIEDRNYNALHRRVSREVARRIDHSKSGRDAASQPCALSEGGRHGPADHCFEIGKEANIEVIKILWRTSRTLRRKITNRIIKAADNADAPLFAVVNVAM